MNGRSWTVDQVVDAGACYTREQIEELWAGRPALTLREVCAFHLTEDAENAAVVMCARVGGGCNAWKPEAPNAT